MRISDWSSDVCSSDLQDSYPGDRLSPTQPFSVAMPQIGVEKLTEQDMWGATPFDQLYCRIKFRQSRWEGQYTPITEKPTLMYPAWYGGTNWGGATIDETRDRKSTRLNSSH